jgi:hypothetical protein
MSYENYAQAQFDMVAGIFEPEAVMPEQFHASIEPGVHGGERRLMAALLSDGVEAYIAQVTKSNSSSQIEVAAQPSTSDAVDWVETRDYSYVFSFDMVCQSLGIDADYLRLGLNRYIQAMSSAESAESGKVWKRIRRPRKP